MSRVLCFVGLHRWHWCPAPFLELPKWEYCERCWKKRETKWREWEASRADRHQQEESHDD